jgi:hypothetical protein
MSHEHRREIEERRRRLHAPAEAGEQGPGGAERSRDATGQPAGRGPTDSNTWVETLEGGVDGEILGADGPGEGFLDYFKATVHERSPGWVVGELAQLLGVDLAVFVDRGYGADFYREGIRGPLGALVLHDNRAAAGKGCVTFSLPGKAMAAVEPAKLQAMLRGWTAEGIRWVTKRIDLTRDGLGASVDQVEDAWRWHPEGVRCRSERGSWDSHSRDGRTFYVGSRSSDRCMRVYDQHGPVRVELECKGAVAEIVSDELVERSVEEWGQVIVGAMADFVDFGTAWWADFVGTIARLRMVVRTVASSTLESVEAWLRRQVAPSLALITAAAGGDLAVLMDLLEDGRRRLRADQWALVPAWGAVRS